MLPFYILRRRLDYISYLVSYINILILRRYILSIYLSSIHPKYLLGSFPITEFICRDTPARLSVSSFPKSWDYKNIEALGAYPSKGD